MNEIAFFLKSQLGVFLGSELLLHVQMTAVTKSNFYRVWLVC